MEELVSSLSQIITGVNFRAGKAFCWSPKTRRISYVPSSTQPQLAIWSLLHEASHALLDHRDYTSDFELLQMEVAAWQKARELAKQHRQKIDEQHIETCLNTYRDWLHRRSTCPSCSLQGLQTDPIYYRCLNCQSIWKVTASRFCRPYRSIKSGKQDSSASIDQKPIGHFVEVLDC